MARCLLIFWVISLPAIFFQLGIKIFCNSQTTDSIAPIPPARADDTVLTIPGCEVFDSFDCLVAKTAFAMPAYCKIYTTTVNCVIYLTPAFCGDIHLPAVQDDPKPLQDCINAVRFGPCEYNTTGRACTSRLFSAFKFLDDPDPPRFHMFFGAGTMAGIVYELELDIRETIFGGEFDYTWNSSIWRKVEVALDKKDKALWDIGQFLVGIFKNVANTPAGLAKLSLIAYGVNAKQECDFLRAISDSSQNNGTHNTWQRACDIHELNKSISEAELPMDNKAQRAGDIFATIASLVMLIVDGAEAIGLTAKIAEVFKVETLAGEVGEGEAMVLRARDKKGDPVVEIWAKGEDGARTMTKAEAETAKENLDKDGFTNLVDCVSAPGGLRKRMNGRPFVACAELAAELDTLPDLDGNFVDDFPFDELDSINNVQAGQPLALNEAALPLVEAAPVQEAAPAQYLAAQAVNPASRDDQFLSDLEVAWLDGPAAAQDVGEADISSYDFPTDPGELVLNEAGPSELVLNEAGPSDPQAFQSSGGFEVPVLPPLNNLPHPMQLRPGSWDICPDHLYGLSDLQQLSFGNAEAGFKAVLDAWRTRYIAGKPAFNGEPLRWLELSRSPGANPDLLAVTFQTAFKLSDKFMNTANALANGHDFRALGIYSQELNKLPRFEGIAHFWRGTGTKLVVEVRKMRSTEAPSWFSERVLGAFPTARSGLTFIKPGLPLAINTSKEVLFIILTRNARLVGPALRMNEAENLIYTQTPAIFKYLGGMKYTFPNNNMPKTAHL